MEKSTGTLFVVATPIGNLEDITLRALRVLAEVDLIAAEDTRITRKLLSRYGISTPLTSYHRHSSPAKMESIIRQLQAGKNIALVSDAGMPGVSDPGSELVRRCVEAGIPLVPIPGASAVTTALAVSGLQTQEFVFIGFLPRSKAKLRRALDALAQDPRTLVIFESPHRILKTLTAINEIFGDRPLAVMRELTKKFEEIYRGTAAEALAHFSQQPPRGEFTLVVAGNGEQGTGNRE